MGGLFRGQFDFSYQVKGIYSPGFRQVKIFTAKSGINFQRPKNELKFLQKNPFS